ncbi:MAG: universal stress protein [Desulfovibrio sp.]
MLQFKKILLPVDGSDHSFMAKQKAIGLAIAMEAEIVLFYAAGWIPGFISGQARDEAVKAQAKEAESVLAPFREKLEAKGVKFSEKTASGNPGDMIAKAARDEGCDIIVMGSRGLGELKCAVMGSVTQRVLSVCDMPVLVVR